MVKYLIALEGPAGAGKTTTSYNIIQNTDADIELLSRPNEIWGVRSYKNECTPMIADFYRLMGLFYGVYPNYISDRFWVSSMIYQPLKTTDVGRVYPQPWSYPQPHLVSDNTIALGDWVLGQMDAMQIRDERLVLPDEIYIDFYILLPSVPLLELNRSKACREYPFVGEVELTYYENFVNGWRGYFNPRLTIGLHPFELYRTDDYRKVVEKAKFEVARVGKGVREPWGPR